MDPSWTLDLLSNRGLSTSILITILLGLWLMLLLTETLGWLFVGVVVPGYLASILVIQPTSALAITVEAFVSLGLARFFAYGLSNTGAWSPFFGRDRFFLIVLVSVLVRQLDQTLVLPWLDLQLRARGLAMLDLNDQFSSIGLVLVPLTANLFWKQSFGRGLFQFVVVLGGTYAVLRGVLLPYTNLTSASMMLLYEDSALNFVSNAKVYIVMISTALLASQVNLKYGWDFGGILIAALLALLWWTPQKVATTLLEAVVLYALALALLKIPAVRQANLEGSRKIVVIFTLGFVLKCLIALAIGDAFVGLKVTDLFAFGYLMSSILAVRMLSEGSALKVLGPVVLVSLVGLGASSLLGLELQTLANRIHGQRRVSSQSSVVSQRLLSSPQGVLAYASTAVPEPWEAQDLGQYPQERVWRALARYLITQDSQDRLELDVLAGDARMIWTELSESGAYLLHPGETKAGAPRQGLLALVRGGQAKGPVVVAHGATEFIGLAQSAYTTCVELDCPALVLTPKGRSPQEAELEGMQLSALRKVAPLLHVVVNPALDSVQDHRGELDATQLAGWALIPFARRLGFSAQDQLMELPARGLSQSFLARHEASSIQLVSGSVHRLLDQWRSDKARFLSRFAQRGPSKLSVTELRLLQQKIVKLLLDASMAKRLEVHTLEMAGTLASQLGLDLLQLPDCGHEGCLALVEQSGPQALIWVLRLGSQNAVDVQVPKARMESGTQDYALDLWTKQQYRSLLIHKGALSFDPSGVSQTHSMFHAIHQGLDQMAPAWVRPQDHLVLSIRGAKGELFAEPGEASSSDRKDLVIGLGEPLRPDQSVDPRLSGLLKLLTQSVARPSQLEIANDRPAMLAYTGEQHLQLRYTRALGYKGGAVIWLSPRLRANTKPARVSNWLGMYEAHTQGKTPQWIDEASFLATPRPALAVKSTRARRSKKKDKEEAAANPGLPRDWDQDLARVEALSQSAHPQALAELLKALNQPPGADLSLVWGARSGRLYLALTKGCARALVEVQRSPRGRVERSPAGLGPASPKERPRTRWALVCEKEITQ